MYLLYLDESGVPEAHPTQTSHYVLLGMAVHVGTWFALDKQILGLKRSFSLGDPHDLELHAAWMKRLYPEQDSIPGFAELGYRARHDAVKRWREDRQKAAWAGLNADRRYEEKRQFRATEPFIHLTFDERIGLLDGALSIVGNYRRGITLFGEAISKASLPVGADPVDQAFSQVVSRFEAFLKRRRDSRQWGLLVVDHDPHKAANLTRLLKRFQRQGTPWGNVERVIEAPFFLDSSANAAVQVADLCAYAVRRYLENEEEDRFQLIFKKFDRTPAALHGIRHYTRRGCTCLICRERGHDAVAK